MPACILLGATGLSFVGAALIAQTSPPPRWINEEPVSDVSVDHESLVDMSALRHFFEVGDETRYNIEAQRLQSLYPDWTPPLDPADIPDIRDTYLDEMWELLSEGKLAELRSEITRNTEQDREVPDELLQKLEAAERRERLILASDLKQFDLVLELAAESDGNLTCQDIDALWRVAEAYAKTGATPRAQEAFAFIIENCGGYAERRATFQKAAQVLDRDIMADLFTLDRPLGDGTGYTEFGEEMDNIARASVTLGGQQADFLVNQDDIQRVDKEFSRSQRADDAAILGWYYFRRDDFIKSEAWFRKSFNLDATEGVAQGLSLSLIALKKPAEAEAVMYDWRKETEDAQKVYLAAANNLLTNDPRGDVPEEDLFCLDPKRVVISEQVLNRIAQEIIPAENVPTAQNMGWYAYSFGQNTTAARWFKKALDWKPDHEPSAYGLALSLSRLNRVDYVQRIQGIWRGRSDRIERLGELCGAASRENPIRVSKRPVLRPSDYGLMPEAYLDARIELNEQRDASPQTTAVRGELTPAVEVRRTEPLQVQNRAPTTISSGTCQGAPLDVGWCLMEADRPYDALSYFKQAIASGSQQIRQDAAYGQSLAYLRLGISDRAAVSATQVPQSAARTKEIGAALLADQALTAFDSGRYSETLILLNRRARISPETMDLMVVRGWTYVNLKRKGDARRIFRAVAATGNAEAAEALIAIDATD